MGLIEGWIGGRDIAKRLRMPFWFGAPGLCAMHCRSRIQIPSNSARIYMSWRLMNIPRLYIVYLE